MAPTTPFLTRHLSDLLWALLAVSLFAARHAPLRDALLHRFRPPTPRVFDPSTLSHPWSRAGRRHAHDASLFPPSVPVVVDGLCEGRVDCALNFTAFQSLGAHPLRFAPALRSALSAPHAEYYPGNMADKAGLAPVRGPGVDSLTGLVGPLGLHPNRYMLVNLGWEDWRGLREEAGLPVGAFPPGSPMAAGDAILQHLAATLPSRTLDDFLLGTHWLMMVVGTPGGGMFHHVDAIPAGSWQVQVSTRPGR